jgi:hypothetical protein
VRRASVHQIEQLDDLASATASNGHEDLRAELAEHPTEFARDRLPATSPGRFIAAFALVAAVAVVVPVVVAHHYGALGIPRDDDWSYLRTLFHWIDTGHLNFNGWVSMTFLGQLALAAPIAKIAPGHITPIQIFTALLGLGGLAAVMSLGLTLGRKLWVATGVALLVAVAPFWGALSVSFMTDVPAFAMSMIAVAIGARALLRRPVSMPLVQVSLAVGLLGFTIREYAAIPALAVAAVAGCLFVAERDWRRVRTLVLSALVILLAAIVFVVLWRTVPAAKALHPDIPNGHSIRNAYYKGSGLFRLLGLVLTPAILAVGPVRIVRRSWRANPDLTIWATVGTGAALAFSAQQAPNIAFAGNYIVPNGVLSTDVSAGRRPDIFPAGVFTTLTVVGTVAAVLLVLATVPAIVDFATRWRERDFTVRRPVQALATLTLTGYIAAYGVAALLRMPIYDRYLLPLIPLAGLLLLGALPVERNATESRVRDHASTRLAVGTAAFVAIAAVGLAYSLDSAAFDGTRWRVATAALHEGWSARQISGGFEWNNFHSNRAARRRNPQACVSVVVDPRPPKRGGQRDVVASAQYTAGFHDPVPVVAVRRRLCIPSNRPSGR